MQQSGYTFMKALALAGLLGWFAMAGKAFADAPVQADQKPPVYLTGQC